MLQIQNMTKTYAGPDGTVTALEELSLSVKPGEFVAVQGPSGCGKTTLLLAAGALLAPDSGKVLINGIDAYELPAERRNKLRAEEIGFIFQQFQLVPYLSVLDNALAPSLALPSGEARERAAELIERFGLNDRRHHVPAELSTGERQRVALARALLNRPKILLADEPTGNLDSVNAETVLNSLVEFAADGGAVLLVTHDAEAAGFAQRVVHLNSGEKADSTS